MKTRIISALVGTVILLAVLLCPYTGVLNIAVAAVAAMAVYELLCNTGRVKSRWMIFGSMLYAVLQILQLFGQVFTVLLFGLTVVYGLYTVLVALRHHATMDVAAAGFAFTATLYVTAGFGVLTLLRALPHGLFALLLVFIIPFMSDTGAYFVGTFFGKHKMTPVISPKKSWEGFFGGWVISVGLTVLAGVIYRAIVPQAEISLVLLALLAFVLAPLSVCGDLIASVIKRQSGIKDYGKIMPGHGGAMDRFDSVVIIAPVLYMLLVLLPVLT